MEGTTLARVGAIAFVALSVIATAFETNRQPQAPEVFAAAPKVHSAQDPLAAELARCSGLGEAGPRDPACLSVWAENRRRFLGEAR